MNRKNKRWANRWKMIPALLAVLFFVMSVLISHAEGEKLLSTVVYEDDIYIYVSGISALLKGTTVQIGNFVCSDEQITAASFQNLGNSMRMLILIDNSKSIPDKNHEDIQTIVNGVITGSREDVLFRIGTFSDQINYLCDYTSDRGVLAEAAGSIVYQDQNTYFSDVLYTLISQLKEEDTSACTRILILSDGADNKSIGYTNDEVRSYIGENAYPVYTVGIPGKNNASELETMFSFSRASSSEYFLLDGSISNEEIIRTLLRDQEGICFKITPDESLKDGSNKSILLKIGTEDGAVELKTNVDMPFGDGESSRKEPEATSEEPEETLPTLKVNNEIPDTPEKEETFPWVFVLLGGIGILLAAIFIVLAIRKKRKLGTEKTEQSYDFRGPKEDDPMEMDDPIVITEDTELAKYTDDTDDAKPLWKDQTRHYYLVIKCLDDSRIMFKVPITNTVCIGRERTADIVLDDPKVSRKHCEIILRGDLLYIKDCNSKNKTYYEDVVVYGEVPMVSGGRFRAGKYQYRVELVKE